MIMELSSGKNAGIYAGAARRQLQWKRFRRATPLYFMLVPGVLFYIIFKYMPMGGVFIAFKDYNLMEGIWKSPWVGLENFEKLFNQPLALETIRNTLMLSLLSLFFGFPVPILLAIMMNEVRRLWYKRLIQTLVYLPHFFSWVIVGGLVVSFFSLESGSINKWLGMMNLEAYPFLYEKLSWIMVFVGSSIWKEMGFSAIIYLAALSSIDPSLYESASMDGAGKLKQMWHITIPGISSTIVIVLILSIGRIMDVGFDHAYVLQNSAVSDVSNVISTFVYRQGIQTGQFGITSAMGLFESIVGFLLVITVNGFARRYEQGLW
jgi:putative aldouronate transport system permease protein